MTMLLLVFQSISWRRSGGVSSISKLALICNCAQSRKGEEGNSCVFPIILLSAVVTGSNFGCGAMSGLVFISGPKCTLQQLNDSLGILVVMKANVVYLSIFNFLWKWGLFSTFDLTMLCK